MQRGLLLITIALAGCAASSEERAPSATVVVGEPVVIEDRKRVDPEFLPALEALERALRDEENEVARSILDRLLARKPEGRAFDLTRSFEKILDGRELALDLQLELVAIERLEQPGTYELSLAASHSRAGEVRYRPGAGRLRETVVAVDAEGADHRGGWTRAVPAVTEIVVPAGEIVFVRLADLDAPPAPGALAATQRVRLDLLAGELLEDGRRLPARERAVGPIEVVRLANYLPTTTVEPQELARYAIEERIFGPALMERAVRVDPAQRGAALDLLAANVELFSLLKMRELVPALRWLSNSGAAGGDPGAWRAFLVARAARGAAPEAFQSSGLDMPAPK